MDAPTVILSLPQSFAKSVTAQQVATYLGCNQVIDEWAPTKPIVEGALHLTNVKLHTHTAP